MKGHIDVVKGVADVQLLYLWKVQGLCTWKRP